MTIIINEKTDKYTLEGLFPVSIAETDCSHLVKPVVILNYMQDLASKSITKYNDKFSCEKLLEQGLGWFLIRYRIEFGDCPFNVQELKIQTESRGVQKLTAFRDFEVFDNASKTLILRATSSWLIVNLESKSVVNISNVYPEFFSFEAREDDLKLQKLQPFSEFDYEKYFYVRYDDLDVNNHVNNTVYITWALEALNFDFRTSHRLKTLDIYFKHEAKYGDEIKSQIKFSDDNLVSNHLIKNAKTDEILCMLKASYATI
jgi:medium-chain acyl-[acyl-carrier-protein] hydrolase